MNQIGLWSIENDRPARIQMGQVGLEKHLEDWIEHDPSLLEHGLQIVARQLRTEAGPLDLLALDQMGRWVLIEIKRERLRREAFAQAIDYASCLEQLNAEQLCEHCNAYLAQQDAPKLQQILNDRGGSVDDLASGLDLIIYLVGTGMDPGLERMIDYLSERANIVIRAVTFSAFSSSDGKLLLAREIHESTDTTPTQRAQLQTGTCVNESDVMKLADNNGVGDILRQLQSTADRLGLHQRLWKTSVMFASPHHKSRCLFTLWVGPNYVKDGEAHLWVSHENFERIYGIPRSQLEETLGGSEAMQIDLAKARELDTGLAKLLDPIAN